MTTEVAAALIRGDRAAAVEAAADKVQQAFGGEVVRFYARKTPRNLDVKRVERDGRISVAVKQGEAPASIAERENVSKRHIRRIRARFGGHGMP